MEILKAPKFQTKQIEDYIVVFKNIMFHKLCDEIVEEYKTSEDFIQAHTVSGENKNIRNCLNLNLSDPTIIKKNFEKRKYLDEQLFAVAGQALNQYRKLFSYATNFAGDSGYTLLKYDIGGKYIYHVDDCNKNARKLSLSLALNNDFTGGEFGFFHGQKVFNLNKGDAIMFPSSFMYPHSVLPVTNGTRYSIVTWFI